MLARLRRQKAKGCSTLRPSCLPQSWLLANPGARKGCAALPLLALFGCGSCLQRFPFSGVKQTSSRRADTSVFVKVFGCRPHEGGAARSEGRRTKTSKGGNRGTSGDLVRQMLWGFRRCRYVSEVG